MDITLSKTKTRGLTLIELLIVIAILLILAGVLFPVFARAREGARRSACNSNLKQLGLCMLQYLQDYDEALVRANSGPSVGGNAGVKPSDPTTGDYKWMDALYPYTRTTAVFDCPSGPQDNERRYVYYRDLSGPTSTAYGSYAINMGYIYGANGLWPSPTESWSGRTYTSLVSIAAPSTTAWIFENHNLPAPATTDCIAQGNCYCFFVSAEDAVVRPTVPDLPGNAQTSIYGRHLATTNVLFCDGHVKALPLPAIAATAKTISGNTIWTILTIDDD